MSAANWFIGWCFEVEVAVPEAPPRVRVFAPEDRHVTLAFFGRCSRGSAEDAWAEAHGMTFEPVDVSIGAVQMLGDPSRPTAVTALLDEGREEIEGQIARYRPRLLAAAGARPDRWPPKAHVTLGRIQRGASPDEYERAVRWAGGLVPEARCTLGKLALYTWSDDRAQRLFRIIRSRAF